jgi:acylphosphatase
MKKSVRLTVTGSIQPMFFERFIKENADMHNIKGFVRNLGQGRAEIFAQGDSNAIDQFIPIAKRGPEHSFIRAVEEKEERFQDLKDFKIMNF